MKITLYHSYRLFSYAMAGLSLTSSLLTNAEEQTTVMARGMAGYPVGEGGKPYKFNSLQTI